MKLTCPKCRSPLAKPRRVGGVRFVECVRCREMFKVTMRRGQRLRVFKPE
jgi:hypothetical protein